MEATKPTETSLLKYPITWLRIKMAINLTFITQLFVWFLLVWEKNPRTIRVSRKKKNTCGISLAIVTEPEASAGSSDMS